MEKKAVIVGGTGQIGKSITDAFYLNGYKTLCISSSPVNEHEQKTFAEYYVYDMSHPKTIEECFDAITKKYDRADVIINSLGKNRNADLYDITEEMWDDVININLKSVFFVCRTFAKLIKANGGGAIINIASTAGIRPLPKSPHYIAAKAGVIALTEYFALALAPLVKVNCVAPGYVLTENHTPEKYYGYYNLVNSLPLQQMTTTEEVAETILFLAESKTITGHTLVVDGGLIL